MSSTSILTSTTPNTIPGLHSWESPPVRRFQTETHLVAGKPLPPDCNFRQNSILLYEEIRPQVLLFNPSHFDSGTIWLFPALWIISKSINSSQVFPLTSTPPSNRTESVPWI